MTVLFSSEMFANHYEDCAAVPFQHFFQIAFTVSLCGFNKPIVQVRVTQKVWIGTEEPGGYWGWWSFSDNKFHHVWPSKMQVEMCFPYGPAVEEKRGRGRLLPVVIDMLRPATQDEIEPHRR